MIATLLATGLLFMQDPPTAPAGPATATSSAAPTQTDAGTPAVTEVDPGDRMVCRREHIVGSNRRERVCMTQRQRARQGEEARNEMNRRTRLPDQNNSGAGDVF